MSYSSTGFQGFNPQSKETSYFPITVDKTKAAENDMSTPNKYNPYSKLTKEYQAYSQN